MVNFRYTFSVMCVLIISKSAFAQEKFWYRSFSGMIDKYPFTIQLHKADHAFLGYYYYNKVQRPLYFGGDDTTVTGKIHLQAYAPGSEFDNETFILEIKGDSLLGEWKKDPSAAGLAVKSSMQPSSTLPFALVYTSGGAKLRPKLDPSPRASYEGLAVWPKGNSAATISLRKLINSSMGFKGEAEIGSLMSAEKKKYLSEYFSEYKNVPDSEIVSFISGYTQDASVRLTVMYHSATILTLAQMNYSYTGGAHGNYGTRYINANPVTGKEYTLSSVLSPAGRKMLDELLDKNFRKERSLTAKESLKEAGLFEDTITANENFFLTGSGIGFNFVPYEIGPYAMGEITVFIPYTEFGKNGLNPTFKK